MAGTIKTIPRETEGAECPQCAHPVWGANEGELFVWKEHMTIRTCQNPDCPGYQQEPLIVAPRTSYRKEYYCSCGKPGKSQYSRGIYAGIWCDACWFTSGWDKSDGIIGLPCGEREWWEEE